MNEISKEEFTEKANPMAAVSADEREFYDLGEDALGVIGTYQEDGRVTVRGHVLRPSVAYGEFRVNETKSESGKAGEGEERARSKVEEWLDT